MKQQKIIATRYPSGLFAVPDGGLSWELKDFESIFRGGRPDDVLYEHLENGWTILSFAVKDAPEDSALGNKAATMFFFLLAKDE
jgi:hypothetical protein